MESENCETGKETQIPKLVKPGQLKVFYTNCDVLTPAKLQELNYRITISHPDIIMLVEIKPKNFKPTLSLIEYKINGYSIESLNVTSDNGRGILIYVKENLKYQIVDTVLTNIPLPQEILIFEVMLDLDKIVLACVYRSPNSSLDNTIKINDCLKNLSDKFNSNLIVVGDFNYPKIDWESHLAKGSSDDLSNIFLECTRDCFFNQLILTPTRGRSSVTPSLLDLVLANNCDIIDRILIQPPLGKSDHSVLELSINGIPPNNSSNILWNYNKGNYSDMKLMFNDNFINELKNVSDINNQYDVFLNKIKESMSQYIPKKVISKRNSKSHFILNKSGKTKLRQKRRLWKQYLQSNDATIFNKYRKVSNQLRLITRIRIKIHEKLISNQVKENPKRFWQYVNNKRQAKSTVSNLYKAGTNKKEFYESDIENATALGKQFYSVFTIDTNEPCDVEQNSDADSKLSIDFSKEVILEKINFLKENKSPGPDEVSVRILKELAEELAPCLSIIFQNSYNTSKIPNSWKDANISAIFKKGDRHEAENYRPISLTSIVCKLMESIIKESLLIFLQNQNIISSNQFGFLPGRSTILQMINVMNYWTEAIDGGNHIDVIYCDFMKAFDKVPHKRLLKILQYYKIPNNLVKWISDFFSKRRQSPLLLKRGTSK